MKEKLTVHTQGQSLLELIIAIGIFTIVVSGLAFLILESFVSGRLASEITIANFLAEEGIEAARSIRDNNFEDLVAGSHGLAIFEGKWIFQGTQEDISDQLGGGTRVIQVEDIDPDRKRVTSQITWQFTKGRPQEVRLVSYLTNWQKVIEAPICAMKTLVNGNFYVPTLAPKSLKVVFLFDNPDLEGDQAGESGEYPIMPNGKVDIYDITLVNGHYGEHEGDPNWEYMADVNSNKKIDLSDTVIVSRNYGKTGTYITDLAGVTILFDTGDEFGLNPAGMCNIPSDATSFTVKKNGVPIGAYILFYSSSL